jgi:hypothetical protein
LAETWIGSQIDGLQASLAALSTSPEDARAQAINPLAQAMVAVVLSDRLMAGA